MEEKKSCRLCKTGESIKSFFKSEHTPLEKGLMVASSLMTGAMIGILLSPFKGFSIGSHNGCNNVCETTKRNKR